MRPRFLPLVLACALAASCDTGSNTSATFQVATPGQIGDRVWKDENGNGLQDPGEAGIEDVIVTLLPAVGAPTATTTDASGAYLFDQLAVGTYVVDVVTPTDLVPTLSNVGNDPAIDSELSPATVVLTANAPADLGVDFGFSGTGSIGDRVWVDEDCNGLQDPGEAELDGVRVTLKDGRGVDRETYTVDGLYLFTGLCAGTYTVAVDTSTVGAGLTPTACNVGPDPALDSDCSPAVVTLTSNGARDDTVDFGYCPGGPGSIGDFVWLDLDQDGLQNPGVEPGLPGVAVFLGDTTGNIVRSTSTDANGNYLFEFLPAGNYVIELAVPDCFIEAPCNVGSDDTIDNDCSPAAVTLAHGEHNRTLDFGYIAAGTAQIGDFVWHDADANGLQDPGETGIEMAVVTLHDDQGFLIGTRWTGTDGRYVFESLCAGQYEVRVDVSAAGAGFVPSPCNVGLDDTIDNDCSPAQVILPFDDTLEHTIDFGFHVPQPLNGCSHGYWKNHPASWTAPYSPSTTFDDVFENAFPGLTLLEVLQQGGGGLNALGREAVAALLNAASSTVRYPLPDREVIDRFDALHPATMQEYDRLKDELEAHNQLGCPLN